jgi:hypothetical protein
MSVDAHRSTAKLARDMAEAMRSRAVIEQAKGILMAERRIDADAAFEQLVELSQHANLKRRDVAHRIVEQRSKPRLTPSARACDPDAEVAWSFDVGAVMRLPGPLLAQARA